MKLSQTTIRGILWNFTELLLRRGVAAITTLLLAHFLLPEDFGLISMAALFMSAAIGLMDSGLREALIRRKYLSARLLKIATLASLTTGSLVYLLLFIASPLIANFYQDPRLTTLIRVGGGQILFGAIQIVPVAYLQQRLDFKSLMKISFPSAVISSAVALGMAFAGFGVWALIAQTLIASAIVAIWLWTSIGIRFGKGLKFRLLVPLYCFGYKLFLSGLIAVVVRNSVPGMIGKYLGPVYAGYYYLVDKIMEVLMGQLVYSVQNVTYSAFSKIGHQNELLRDAYRKTIRVMVFVISPLLAIGAGMSDLLFRIFLSESWWPAENIFRWLCLTYMFYPVHALNLNILKVRGRSDLFLGLEIVKAVISLSVLWFALSFGLEVVLWSQIVVSILCYIPNVKYSKPLIGYSVSAQLYDVLPYFGCALVAGFFSERICVYFFEFKSVFVLIFGSAASIFVYIFLVKAFNLEALSLLMRALQPYRRIYR